MSCCDLAMGEKEEKTHSGHLSLNKRRALCVPIVLILLFASYHFILSPLLDAWVYKKSYGHFYGEKDYEYYSRTAYNKQKWGDARYNLSSCKFHHFPIKFLTQLPYDYSKSPQNLRVFIYRFGELQMEWLWNTVLQSHGQVQHSENIRFLPEFGLEIVRLNSRKELVQHANEIETLFIIFSDTEYVEYFATHLAAAGVRSTAKIGAFMLNAEYCMAPTWVPKAIESGQIQFLLMAYGDCDIVDNKRVFLWPMGPFVNALGALDAGTLPAHPQPMSKRKIDASLIASLRMAKPSRPQAMMSLQEVCSIERWNCVQRTGFTIYSILGDIGKALGEQYHYAVQRWFGAHWLTEYMGIMWNSKLTLCPSGSNPNSYRIMEAIMMGTIPIIEDWQEEGVSPLYGPKFKCLRDDNMAFLRDTHAPVFWVRDFREDLASVMDILHEPAELQAMQDHLMKWYSALVTHLRLMWIREVWAHFAHIPAPPGRTTKLMYKRHGESQRPSS